MRQVQQRVLLTKKTSLNHCCAALILLPMCFLKIAAESRGRELGRERKHKETETPRRNPEFRTGLNDFVFFLSVVLHKIRIDLISLHIINSTWRSHHILQVFENV